MVTESIYVSTFSPPHKRHLQIPQSCFLNNIINWSADRKPKPSETAEAQHCFALHQYHTQTNSTTMIHQPCTYSSAWVPTPWASPAYQRKQVNHDCLGRWMQQLVMTLTTISVITAFSLRSSEKLLLLWNRVKLLRMGCCFLKPVLQYLWACKKDWGTTDVFKGWQTCQWSPRRSPSFWSSTWTVGRPLGWAVDSLGEGKWMPPSTAVHLHPAFPLSCCHQLASVNIWAPF